MTLAEVLDGLILLWLVGTWFYEGHHRACSVATVCRRCGSMGDEECMSPYRRR
jgi:hypothetical protein